MRIGVFRPVRPVGRRRRGGQCRRAHSVFHVRRLFGFDRPGLCGGLVTGYTLMKFLVFESSGRVSVAEYFRYFLVNMAALGQVWALSVLFKDHVLPAVGYHFHADTVAHTVGVLSPIVTSYLLHKKYTFSSR